MERLMLLDGFGLVYRGYYALPPLTTSKGELVNGVFGFCSIVLRGIASSESDTGVTIRTGDFCSVAGFAHRGGKRGRRYLTRVVGHGSSAGHQIDYRFGNAGNRGQRPLDSRAARGTRHPCDIQRGVACGFGRRRRSHVTGPGVAR